MVSSFHRMPNIPEDLRAFSQLAIQPAWPSRRREGEELKSDAVLGQGSELEPEFSTWQAQEGRREPLAHACHPSEARAAEQKHPGHICKIRWLASLFGQEFLISLFRRCLRLLQAEDKGVCYEKVFKCRCCFRWPRTPEDIHIHRSWLQSIRNWGGDRMGGQ